MVSPWKDSGSAVEPERMDLTVSNLISVDFPAPLGPKNSLNIGI